jgi:enamine deaminase RidA (YjgF/YER057c/UK114 family)
MDIQSLLQMHAQLAQQEAVRKEVMARLDDPQVRTQLRGQLQVALGQIDALAAQIAAQLDTVTQARARVVKVMDAIDKAPSLSAVVARKFAEASAAAGQINANVTETARTRTRSVSAASGTKRTSADATPKARKTSRDS